MGWKSEAESKHDRLVNVAMEIEEARSKIKSIQLEYLGAGLNVTVTDPLQASVVQLDKALEGLDTLMGAALRAASREQLKMKEGN